MKFMPGVYVFPGGAIDAEDGKPWRVEAATEGTAEEAEAGAEDEMSAEMLGADAISEPEEAEKEEEDAFEATLASDEFEDEDEEPLGHRAGRARARRTRRAADDWEGEP